MEKNYILIATLLLIGFLLGKVFRKFGFTEVLAYIIAGIIIGPILHIQAPSQLNSIVTGVTLAFVAYTVGLSFSFSFLKRMGKKIFIILIVQVLITTVVVGIIVYLFTKDLPLSIILASLAPATAPAGTIAVLRSMKAKGKLTNILVAIVGLDDALAILIFSVGLIFTKTLLGFEIDISTSILIPLKEIFGAVFLGIAIGLIISYLSKKIKLSSDNIFVICIASIILCWGIATLIEVSAILACMVLGTTIINFNVHIGKLSNSFIDNFETPLFILFFVLIGMKIDFSQFVVVYPVVIIYSISRIIGKISGTNLGAYLSKSETKIRKFLGIAMLDQAGVAIGLAFLASQELSGYEIGNSIIIIMALTTTLFQLIAPFGIQFAVKHAREANV